MVSRKMLLLIAALLASTTAQPADFKPHALWQEIVQGAGDSNVVKTQPEDASEDYVENLIGEARQSGLANTIGGLFRPAITALVGTLSMNLATSFTNAVTATLEGRSLEPIPIETLIDGAGRNLPIQQSMGVLPDTQVYLKTRPLKRRRRIPNTVASSSVPQGRSS